MTEAQEAPPGMYFDPASGLFLPQGVRLASRAQVAAAWFLGLLLFIVTLGIGYVTWSMFAWAKGDRQLSGYSACGAGCRNLAGWQGGSRRRCARSPASC